MHPSIERLESRRILSSNWPASVDWLGVGSSFLSGLSLGLAPFDPMIALPISLASGSSSLWAFYSANEWGPDWSSRLRFSAMATLDVAAFGLGAMGGMVYTCRAFDYVAER